VLNAHEYAFSVGCLFGKVSFSSFANHSIRFAELVLRMVDRKPSGIERSSYSLIRFDAKGRPDMDRIRQQSDASIRAHQGALLDH